uniref:Fanconi anemia group I protein n=2 Tax=Caenorhabditis tropicalis TaxID=1561998 RepID=A0A1I7T550_9PELO
MLNKLIVAKNNMKKKSPLIEAAIRKLLPKVLDSISSISSSKIELTRRSIPKMVELVANEKYSYADQANVLFYPLQVLNKLHSDFDVWEKSWAIIKPRLNALKMSSPQSSIVVFYVLSLIFRNDCSQICHLVDYLASQYQEETVHVKNTILVLLEIMERLDSPIIRTYFKENRVRHRLLLDSELEITLQYLPDFTNSELNHFLQEKSFSEEQFSILVDKLSNLEETSISSESFWRSLLEKMNEKMMNFIEKQLKLLINRQERKSLSLRIEQIFKRMKEMNIEDTTCILRISTILLNLSDSQYQLLPQNATMSLVSLLIQVFCTSYETKAPEINQLFNKFHSKINKTSIDSRKEPIEVIEDICEEIKCKSIQGPLDFHFLKKANELKPELASRRERNVVVSSILFEKLASGLQSLGDRDGKLQYCVIVTIIDSYVNKLTKEELIPNYQVFQKVCERAMEGFAMYEAKWNWLFIAKKISTIFVAAKRYPELLKKLIRIVNKNKDLHAKLTSSNKEYSQMEQSINN